VYIRQYTDIYKRIMQYHVNSTYSYSTISKQQTYPSPDTLYHNQL